jgi:hypothetical protein
MRWVEYVDREGRVGERKEEKEWREEDVEEGSMTGKGTDGERREGKEGKGPGGQSKYCITLHLHHTGISYSSFLPEGEEREGGKSLSASLEIIISSFCLSFFCPRHCTIPLLLHTAPFNDNRFSYVSE